MTDRLDLTDLADLAGRTGGAGEVVVADAVTSTHSLIREAALSGAAAGTLLVADEQTAGRGRVGRSWWAPPGTAVLMSWVWRPAEVAAPAWGWLPLLVGVAVSRASERVTGIPMRLKWPNDVLAEPQVAGARGGKVAGVLLERVDTASGPAAIVGVGINVGQRGDQLPVPTATSLSLAGAADVSRVPVLEAVLAELTDWYDSWRVACGDAAACELAQEYRRRSATLGRTVHVDLPGDRWLAGRAEAIEADGRLVVVDSAGRHVVGAGDVVHLR